eukprot:scaffold35832_cov53-Phaeocystis_antarctica.AAC.6
MSVTLDVSKLSGWLNADAACRVTTRTATRGVGGGGAGGGASSVQGGPNGHGGQDTRGAHIKHAAHVRDAGGVPARYIVIEKSKTRS